MKITKRDFGYFVLGLFTFFLIESIMDWEGTKKSFNNGWNSAHKIESEK
jgi:hypothetical protein